MLALPDSRLRPRECVRLAADVFGRDEVVRWSEGLLSGDIRGSDPRYPDISWLKGAPGWPAHWDRVWGARALLHLGPADPATLLAATRDESWRVREMALKVIAAHRLPDPTGIIDALVDDPVERVRVQAWRALGRPADEAHA